MKSQWRRFSAAKAGAFEPWIQVLQITKGIKSELSPCSFKFGFRIHTLHPSYMLATELHTHLDDLSGSLTQMIDSVNSLTVSASVSGDGKTQQGEDPMAQIAQILSNHLESLQWIDGAVREVESKITEVERGVREANSGIGPVGANKSRGFGVNR